MYRVLLITDDWKAKRGLKSGLMTHGFQVVQADSNEVFQEDFVPKKLDVVVVDLERLGVETAKLCRLLRSEPALKDTVLVLLVLASHLGSLDVAWGFEDYLTLPISDTRLAERLKFLMWKMNKVEVHNGYSTDELLVDFERYEVHVKGKPIDLTYKEFELLKYLILNPSKVLTRDILLDKVWGYDYYGGTRTVDVHIRRLRSKIEVGSATYIETVRNVGYKFLPKK